MPDVYELRLRYSAEGMSRVIAVIDRLDLGVLPEEFAIFLVHASNAANWHGLTANDDSTERPR